MFEIINVKAILIKHLESLRKDTKLRWALLVFVIIPAIAPVLLLLYNKPLTAVATGILLTAFVLFAGLMLNMVILLFNIVSQATKELDLENPESEPRILLERLYANTLYSVLVGILVLVVLVFVNILELWHAPAWMEISNSIWFLPNPIIISNPWLLFPSVFVYFMTIHFLMNLLMIVKRLFALLSVQLRRLQSKHRKE